MELLESSYGSHCENPPKNRLMVLVPVRIIIFNVNFLNRFFGNKIFFLLIIVRLNYSTVDQSRSN